ncbi:TorF family putative porin [Thalassolituus sp. LLYu03]|uniref:TorF family putative porin n=1 Tax=Thalassolituus sp. LLYu03 TaxID=3421656 RepID=UPI003D271788
MTKAGLWLLALLPGVCGAEVALDVSVVSDFRSYGISQTGKSPALQLALDYSHESGMYLGSWASNVDYGNGDDTRLEWDFYGGYATDLNDAVGLDLGYAWYSYHGADYSGDADYGETVVGLTLYGRTSVYWFHATDFSGLGIAHNVFSLSHAITLGDYSLAVTLAHNLSSDKNVVAWDEDKADYQYLELAISREFAGFNVTAAAMATTIDNDFNSDADPALVVSVNRGFTLLP